jgi:hypothetical protein
MVEPRLRKTKQILMRWLKWCLALFVLGLIGFVTLITGALSVGYLNMTAMYWSLKPNATLAMDYPLEPGQSEIVRREDGRLVAQRMGGMGMGGMRIGQTPDGDRYVVFDRGGGHLGNQGYVYAPHAEDSDQVHQDAFGGFEGREVSFLFGDWYTYDSTED